MSQFYYSIQFIVALVVVLVVGSYFTLSTFPLALYVILLTPYSPAILRSFTLSPAGSTPPPFHLRFIQVFSHWFFKYKFTITACQPLLPLRGFALMLISFIAFALVIGLLFVLDYG